MYLGIDLGGTKISAILLDQQGEKLAYQRIATPQGDYSACVYAIAELAKQFEQKARLISADSKLQLSLGIGTPGSVSRSSGLMKNANSTCLNGQALAADIEARLQRPVILANDADCFALAEAQAGAYQNATSVFGVILGTGVGGGLVYQNALLQGPNGICGEWGHNSLPANTPRVLEQARACYCGRSDCIETYLSGPGLALSWQQLCRQQHLPCAETVTAAQVAQQAQQGVSSAQAVLSLYQQQLAAALAQVINIFDPEVIILGGGVSNISRLYDGLLEHLAAMVFSDRLETKIVAANLGDDAGVYGAAWLNR